VEIWTGGNAIPFLGLFVSNFLYFFFAVLEKILERVGNTWLKVIGGSRVDASTTTSILRNGQPLPDDIENAVEVSHTKQKTKGNWKPFVRTLIKKKRKFSICIRKLRKDRLQSHIKQTAFSYMTKNLHIFSYIRKPFLIYDYATDPN
jgi:hypothetical protein